jgi:2-hydroxy-6-oxonona-2,4-dienedioate hydrolase
MASFLSSRWDYAQGWKVHARVSSLCPDHDRHPLVLVHGLSQSSRYFIPLAERLSRNFSVYVPDFPGYGLSEKPAQALNVSEMADFLSAWMSVVEIGSAVLVGNSLGCQVIAEMALRHPGRLYRAVLIGPTVDRRRRTPVQQIVRTLRAGLYEDLSLIPKVLFDYALAGVRRSFQAMQHAINHEVEHLLPHMSVPTLVVRGSRDPLCPQRWAEEVNSFLPDGRLVIIPGGGHGVHYSLAGETAKVILDFLD